jgi:hypothetical protein
MYARCKVHATKNFLLEAGFFDGGDGHFAGNGGILFEELIESVAALQIVRQDLEGHARSAEDGLSAKDVRVFNDDSSHLHRLNDESLPSQPWHGASFAFPPAPEFLYSKGNFLATRAITIVKAQGAHKCKIPSRSSF